MLYIVWQNSNNTDVRIIDEQHRGIVSIINSLHYFIQGGRGDEIIKPTMTMLQQYTNIHFKTEEALMEEANYPAIEEHIVLHRKLAKKTKTISLDASMMKDADMVLNFLKEWWLTHINKEDRKYTPFLRT